MAWNEDPTLVVLDVDASLGPDLAAVEVLARLQLEARRAGYRVQLRGASRELRELLELSGLQKILPCGAPSRLEPGRQVEQREQPLGLQEERDPGQPVA
jgi:hypothetical protein